MINYWKNSCPNSRSLLKNWWLERYQNLCSLKRTKRLQMQKKTWFQNLNLSLLVFPSSKHWSQSFSWINRVFRVQKTLPFILMVRNVSQLKLLLIIFWIISYVWPFCCWHVFLHSINHQLEFPPSGKGCSDIRQHRFRWHFCWYFSSRVTFKILIASRLSWTGGRSKFVSQGLDTKHSDRKWIVLSDALLTA